MCVSACLIHSYDPIKNDLRAFLKRPNLSNNTLTWRRHWPHSNSWGLIPHPHRLVHVLRCHLCPSSVSFPGRAGGNKWHICTFNLHQRGIFPHRVLPRLPAVDEVDILKHLRSSSRRSTGWALSLSLHLSSGIFTHFAECGTCNGTLLRFNATEAAVPWAPAGRRLFLALELCKVRLLHPLPPASRRKPPS